MYKLLKPFPNGLAAMIEYVQQHIARIGLEAVTELKGDNVRFLSQNLTFLLKNL